MFERKATEKRLNSEVSYLAQRIGIVESRISEPTKSYIIDVLVNILEQAGILVEVEEQNLKGKVVHNNKTYKVKKVK